MKRNKKKMNGKFQIIMLMALIVMLLCACSKIPGDDVDPTVSTEQETQPPVQVAMPDYEFTYSGVMANVIAIKELEDSNNLEFTVKTSQEEFTIFIMHFNTEGGDLVEFLTDSKGNKVPVSFEMMPVPEGLKDDDKLLFYQAQESVNDIVASISLK